MVPDAIDLRYHIDEAQRQCQEIKNPKITRSRFILRNRETCVRDDYSRPGSAPSFSTGLLLSFGFSTGSVPPIVPHLYQSSLYPHGQYRNWFVGRGREDFTGTKGKFCAVARAYDYLSLQVPAGELPAVVRTDILHGEIFSADVEYGDLDPIHIDNLVTAGKKLVCTRYVNPLGHNLDASLSK